MLQDVSSDSRFIDVGDLPSGQKPYSFKRLFVRPLAVKELKLIAQSAALDDIRHLIRAIDMVIDQDVNDITIGDFFYLMMWLRIKSYPKSPLTVSWRCRAKYFVEAGEPGSNKDGPVISRDDVTEELITAKMVKEKQCDNINTDLIRLSNIEIICIPDEFEGLDDPFDYPRVRLLPEIIDTSKEPDTAFIVDAAKWLKAGSTLKDKIEIMENEPDLSLYERTLEFNETLAHGVKERVKLKCQNCTTEYDHALEINPTTFFRR